MILSKQKNSIEVKIDGTTRKIKIGMAVSEMLIDMLMNDQKTYINPFKRAASIVRYCLIRSKAIEEDKASLDDVYEMIDDMDDKDRDRMFKFIEECLGFIMKTQTESLVESMGVNIEELVKVIKNQG